MKKDEKKFYDLLHRLFKRMHVMEDEIDYSYNQYKKGEDIDITIPYKEFESVLLKERSEKINKLKNKMKL